MKTPLDIVVETQWSCIDQWLRMMRAGADVMHYTQRRQAEFFRNPYGMRSRDVIPHGADWFENYGKRCRDVNVERV